MNETEQRIYTIAKDQFCKNGYYNTTVRNIAKLANVNSGLFNYYFQNKHNLARQIYDKIYKNIFELTLKYFSDEKNPAVFMGVMMRLHIYMLDDNDIIKFSIDALKECIYEESVLNTSKTLIRNISNFYNLDMSEESLHLLLSITLATEKTSLMQKYRGFISFDLQQIANTVLKIHLQGFNLNVGEITELTEIIVKKFEFIRTKNPNFVQLIIGN